MYRIGKEEAEAATRVIMDGNLFRVNGGLQETVHFEEEFAAANGSKYALIVTSGTGALACCLTACGIGPGDEVIVPAYTFISTAQAALAVGAIPVLCEVDETLTLDPEDLKKKISSHTKAVIPVHIAGFPCKMDEIVSICREKGIFVIEDACQADGGSYKGKKLGTWGDMGAFSFNAFKIIGAGEGGAFISDNKQLFDRARIQHDIGAPFWATASEIDEPFFSGGQMRVSELTSAVMRVQLTRLDSILAGLRKNREIIYSGIASKYKIKPSYDYDGDCATTPALQFDTVEEAEAFEQKTGFNRPINTGRHVYVNWEVMIEKRGAFNDRFNPFNNPYNKDLNLNCTDKDACPKSLEYLARTVYIPNHPDMTEDQLKEIIQKINK